MLFYAPNWSDERGASYGHFSGFSSPTFEARKKNLVVGNPLKEKKLPTMAGISKKSILRLWEAPPDVALLDSFHCTQLERKILDSSSLSVKPRDQGQQDW